MKLIDIGKRITIEDIVKLEDELNVKLPIEYKEFMLKNNGGYIDGFLCTPDFIEIDPLTQKEYSQSTNPDKFYSLEEVREAYYDNVEDPVMLEIYIAVAYDSSGNNILLCADESEDNGNVYFANHELYVPENGFWVLTKIADSFNEFVESLKPIKYDE